MDIFTVATVVVVSLIIGCLIGSYATLLWYFNHLYSGYASVTIFDALPRSWRFGSVMSQFQCRAVTIMIALASGICLIFTKDIQWPQDEEEEKERIGELIYNLENDLLSTRT